jgi:HK97 family phage major capsid protein
MEARSNEVTEKFRSNPLPFAGAIGEDAILGVSIATTGEAAGHRLLFDQVTLSQLEQLGRSKASGVKSRFTHPDWFHDGLGKYLGRVKNFRLDIDKVVGDLYISRSAHSSPAGDIGQYVLDLAREDPSAFGVSIVVDLDRVWVASDGQEVPVREGRPSNARDKYPVARLQALYAADLVDDPALNPNGLFNSNFIEGECNMPEEEVVQEQNQQEDRLATLEETVKKLASTIEGNVIQVGGQPPRGQISGMPAAMEQFQAYFEWLFGAPGAKLPPPELRRADALYRAVTGDVDMKGVFDPSHVAFAAATTATLADLAVNAMNKVVLDLYTNLTAYRWFEQIVAVQPTDGSLQDMQWLQMGGVTNLPVVAEGAAYTELSVVDTKETSSFNKYGGYVGITDKMLRNSQIDRLQAIPRALTISAIRTRSAAIAAIFTTGSGQGPTLAQDSKELFKSDNSHGNYATTALSIAAWAAARLECAKQAELGSAKRQVLWPRFLLVPIDLYDTALVMFGYGAGPGGYPGTPNNDVNPYAQERSGDPRPIIIAVPEWTDTTDWAYIVDPQIAPVLCMAYGDNPGGRTHPAPQLYSVTDPTSGLLFTNDTLPIKVRDLWAYGVATYRGIGKRIVAGA